MQKLDRIELVRVKYIPRALEPGVLYVAEEFGAAVHLCACGCGSKVSTPLGPTEWALDESEAAVTLTPSVGNWQLPCRSHYWIRGGSIIWSGDWTSSQIEAGRRRDEARRRSYYEARTHKPVGLLPRIWRWLRRLFE